MKLVLGSGGKKHNGAYHVDIRESALPELVHDLNIRPWPFKSGEFDEVIAEDIIEHLDDVVATIEEIHRVLKADGYVTIVTPHYLHRNSWDDPSHKWHLSERSFDYFDPSTPWGKKYDYYSPAKFRIEHKGIDGGNIYVVMRRL